MEFEVSKSVGLEKKDAMNRARWRVGVREIAAGVDPATPVYGDKPGSKLDWLIVVMRWISISTVPHL